MILSSGEKGILSRANFEWNKNNFCQFFRHTKNAEDFIAVWEQSTIFNEITQKTEPCISAEFQLDRYLTDEQPYEDTAVIASPQTSSVTKRPAEEPISQNAKKKYTNSISSSLDQSIEDKKAAMCTNYSYVFTLQDQNGCAQYRCMHTCSCLLTLKLYPYITKHM